MWLVKTLGILGLIGAGALYYMFLLNGDFEKKFAVVAHGDTESDIVRDMGKPSVARKCGDTIAWETANSVRPNTGLCITEYVYYSLIPLSSEACVLGLNPEHRVVSKYRSQAR